MKAIIWTAYGPPEVLEPREIAQPVPGPDDVLIRIRAANAFPGDAEMRRFQMHPSMWLPVRLMFGVTRPRIAVLGQEVSGEVAAVGENVTRFAVGDTIFGSTGMKFGGYAEYVALPAKYPFAIKPDSVSHVDASTITIGGGNALHFIRLAALKPGMKILINGACGSIGTYAVQLARLEGAEVTVVDSSDKLETLEAIGAHHLIDYQKQDFTRSGIEYDVVFDIVGKSHYARSLACVKPGGRYLLANHGLTVMARGAFTSRMGNKAVVSKLANPDAADIEHLAQLIADGRIRAVVDRVFPLSEAVAAHRYIDSGRRQGHVVLEP